MPRLFTALELPERIVSQLAVARGGLVGARWLEAEDYHVTLRFIGDVDGRAARDITEALGDIRRPKALVRIRGLELVRRRQAAGHHRQGEARPGADGSAGRAGAAPETYRRRAGDAQIYAACDAGAAARRRCRPLSPTISPPAARFRRRRSPPSASRSIRPATGRAGDPMSSRPPIRWARLRATKSKPTATKSKSAATKSKSGATKSKPAATNSKCISRPRIESFQ